MLAIADHQIIPGTHRFVTSHIQSLQISNMIQTTCVKYVCGPEFALRTEAVLNNDYSILFLISLQTKPSVQSLLIFDSNSSKEENNI
jgi:hypothetical protein